MSPISENYYTRRIRESHEAMLKAKESGSRIAHAQLEAAYRVLSGEAEALLPCPVHLQSLVGQSSQALAPPAHANDITDVKLVV